MPIIAVGVALYSVATAASVGFAALSAFQIIGTVSAVVGAVGAVTKNKTLQTIGLIGGAVGAVGSFAQASGWLEGTGLTKSGGDAFNKAFTSGSVFKGSETTGTINQGASTVTDAASKTTSLPTTPAPVTGELPNTLATANANASGVTDTLAAGAPLPGATLPGATPPADTSLGGSFLKFAKDNPMVAYSAITTAGTFAAGLFDPTSESTIAKTEAEAALLKTQNDVLAQQKANMAGPLSQFRPSPVAPQPTQQVAYAIDPLTGKAVAPKPIAQGLINANTVTGVPA